MTLQLRPTFSESWYRVKTLRVRLRPSAQISRQYYRGERWYVVRDPAGNQFHRLSDPAYRFIGLLDGTRTVEEAWDLAGGQLADDAPTQPEVIQILSHLFSANLIDADVTPDATVLLRRHKKLQKRKLQGRLMNVLFPRIPLWDPDRFLKLWMPVVRLLFSRVGAVIWLLVVGLAIFTVLPMGPELATATRESVNISEHPENAVYLWGVFILVKLIHELGHAFGCRRFGGECHEMGIMFLVFIPTPYVDASSAWAFPNKWHRIFVGAAGMIVELFFAALITFVWAFTAKDTVLSQLMFNAMLVASVSTVIFNANPLLRYDGYYILSDWLEIPNLRQKSSEYALGLIKRHLFRVKLWQPLPLPVQRIWLLFYAITSSIYRIMVGFAIMMLVYFEIPVLGVLMAIGGVATWLLVPFFKTFKYLALEPELHRKRGRAVAITAAFVTAVVVLIGMIRFPVNIDEVGVFEPDRKQTIRALTPGFIAQIGWNEAEKRELRDGDAVKAGAVLLVLKNDTLEAQIKGLEARIQSLRVELGQSTALDPLKRDIDRKALTLALTELKEARQRKADLTVRAAFDGQFIAPNIHQMKDTYVALGQEVAMVADMRELEVVTLLEQRDSEQVLKQVKSGNNVPDIEVRPAGRIGQILNGTGIEDWTAATREKVPQQLMAQAGGEIQPDPSDPSGTKPMVEQFELRVKLNPETSTVFTAGQRAYVRFKLDNQPLLEQWARRFWQLIQERQATKTTLS